MISLFRWRVWSVCVWHIYYLLTLYVHSIGNCDCCQSFTWLQSQYIYKRIRINNDKSLYIYISYNCNTLKHVTRFQWGTFRFDYLECISCMMLFSCRSCWFLYWPFGNSSVSFAVFGKNIIKYLSISGL